MYTKRTAVTVLVGLASLAVPARADDAAVRKELDRLNARLVDATRRRDVKGAVTLMTPDFRMKRTRGGWLNLAQTEAEMRKAWPAVAGYRSWITDVRNLKVSGKTATATVEERVVADVKDRTGSTRTLIVQTLSKEEWLRTAGGWKFRQIEDLLSRVTNTGATYIPKKLAVRKSPKRVAAAPKSTVKPGITEADARRFLESAYAASRKAFRAKDAAGVMALTTSDYAVESQSRLANRHQVEQELRKELLATKRVVNWTAKIGAISIAGDTFTANVSERKVTIILDSAGKPHTSDITDSIRDQWVKTPAGWRNRRAVVVDATVKIDGKPQAE